MAAIAITGLPIVMVTLRTALPLIILMEIITVMGMAVIRVVITVR